MDSGDVLTGRPYGYTEEYQSYEQTGTEQYQTGTTTTYPGGSSTCTAACGRFFVYGGYAFCAIDNGIVAIFGGCRHATQTPTYGTRPVYGYVTRIRTVTYDRHSGLFSIGVGIPYEARNKALYSTQGMRIIIG